jgi:putative ABC transport system permease protein
MRASPVVRAARGGLAGRRVQAVVIGLVVLVATAASTLALGLLVDSNAPFDHAFAAQHGSEVTATTRASAAQLAATTRLPGVTATAGPFPETTVNANIPVRPPPGQSGPDGVMQQPLTVVGRASPGGPVDDLTLTSGHWATQPGQVVLADVRGPGEQIGTQITVTSVPGSPRLTIVGFATSITQTAQAWVAPAEIAALRAPGTPGVTQMLYRFSSAGTTGQVNADIAALRAALPHGALLGAQSYLTVKLQDTGSIAPWVPFIVAFGVIGLVLSVLIVANVVSGAVVAGTRRIGVLKSIGFSPAQVVASYLIQVVVPAMLGCLAGVVAGNLLSVPLLGQTAQAYANAVGAALGQDYSVQANGGGSSQFYVIIGLIATLTLLLVAVAGLGVLNTVVLQTRERVHDLGVFKAVGMTPRQTIAMVVCSVAGIGLAAGLIAIPAGIALHHYVLPVMGNAAQTAVPPSVLNVYQLGELVLLAVSGLVIAVAGALLPAGWAARTRTASALRAE